MKTIIAVAVAAMLSVASTGYSQYYGGPPWTPQRTTYPIQSAPYHGNHYAGAAYHGSQGYQAYRPQVTSQYQPTPSEPTYQAIVTDEASASYRIEDNGIFENPTGSANYSNVTTVAAESGLVSSASQANLSVTNGLDSCTGGSCAMKDCSCGPCISRCSNNCMRNSCHDIAFFGEYLYLRPRNAEINFASQIDGPVDPDQVPTFRGTIGNVDPDYSSGFRAGMIYHWDNCSSIVFTGTRYENATSNTLTNAPGDVLFPTTMHPTTFDAATTVLSASAAYSMDFDLIDLDFNSIWFCGSNYQVNYTLGVRYTRFDQDYAASYVFNNTDNVTSKVSFDGAGIRLGLDGERFQCGTTGFSLYGKCFANFLGGQARGQFYQADTGNVVRVLADWEAGRLMTQLEAELGFGWTSRCETWKLQTGYAVNGWFNTVQVADMIQAAHTNQFDGIGSTLTFDGLTARIEYRY